jgi:hypothetical protein
LSKKQESFAVATNNGMKPFALIMALRTAILYDGSDKCAERAPRTVNEKPVYAIH